MNISRQVSFVVYLLFLCISHPESAEAGPKRKPDSDQPSRLSAPHPPHSVPQTALSRTGLSIRSGESEETVSLARLLENKRHRLKVTGKACAVNTKIIDTHPFACSSSADFLKQIEETKFEKYYSEIEPYTFDSVILPFSIDELVGLYNYNAGNRTENASWKKALLPVSEKINEGMGRLGKEPGKDSVFVRLSTRSPKDSAIMDKRIQDCCHSALQVVQEEERQIFSGGYDLCESSPFNQRLQATYIAATQLMSVKDGNEAIELLIKSERIRADLEEAVNKLESEGQNSDKAMDFSLIVREFGEFKVRREVRGFVHGNKLTALTQYNHLCYFPATVHEKHEIQEAVQKFMKAVIPNISFMDSYVVDLVIMDDFTVKIIEINPFSTCADAGLFNWTIPDDQEILLGRKPFEYRLVETLPNRKWVLANMNKEYIRMIHECFDAPI